MMRRKDALIITRFQHVARLACEVTGARFERVVGRRVHAPNLRKPDLTTAFGADQKARELAGYLVVTSYDVTRKKLARGLAVDRSTVSKWCRRCEDLRDNNPDFDTLVTSIERILRPDLFDRESAQ